jgi:peptidoglycan hydrolase-like protein with peptidoglycan-binding domain
LPNVEPRLTTPKRPARSASEPTPKPKPKPTATPKPPTFDPARAKWGLWPLNASKPQLRRGAKGDAVRYVQGVIAHNAGGNIAVDGDYGMQTWYRVQQVQVFFGLVVDGKVGPETWLVIDELATS